MMNYILKCLKEYDINLKGQKIVVGVSTGVDSMSLLYSLQQLNLDCEIIVAHVNHGKREQSATEEIFIKNYCDQNHLRCFVRHLSHDDFKNENFQEEARYLRKQFFHEIMDQNEAKFLMLAHHLNDDIETMLMRLLRGSNLKGYAGMDEYSIENGKIVLRPFLKVQKKDIIEFAKANKITYYEDASNATDVYTRNRIRKNIEKELFKENPHFETKYLEFKKTINEASLLINSERDNYINILITKLENGFTFKKDSFLKLSEFFQVEILFELLFDFHLSKVNIYELLKYVNSDKQNLKVVYKKLTFVKEYNDIFIYFSELNKKEINIVIDGLGEYRIDDKYVIKVSKKSNNYLTNLNKIWYNSNMLPLVARTRLDGDKIALDYGTKKVKKLLIDRKVGISKREETLVLEKDGEILAVFGHGKSVKLKNIQNCDIMIELKEKEYES